ncbi:YggS family pyridoxal phosphate-dependent enzyme [Musicola paradisiaca]|uniref:Pyridoxal phosphate homeostasis protein n=1 Tax=Musicola paradisiaca (strain Ech703) TaxID=579405 RepID=C6C7K9_MUSP7|nr:YggS family pyridoxal phosphate-dependent enzyme [Musicola paradisiaca]ACS85951.1 alanine racemase domain protein [Musicola paradisiaca Ech703]
MMKYSNEEALDNYLGIKASVEAVSRAARLLVVSKFHTMDKIQPLIHAGHRCFGESRVDEAINKWDALRNQYEDLELHFIGGLQSRKVAKIVEFFDVIQSVDRASLADKISSCAKSLGKTQKIFIQINIGDEPQKSGVSVNDFDDVFAHVSRLDNICIEGVMCIPPNEKDVSVYFSQMSAITEKYHFPQLSMGMSNDYKLALCYNSTMVRVGSAIFGERS